MFVTTATYKRELEENGLNLFWATNCGHSRAKSQVTKGEAHRRAVEEVKVVTGFFRVTCSDSFDGGADECRTLSPGDTRSNHVSRVACLLCWMAWRSDERRAYRKFLACSSAILFNSLTTGCGLQLKTLIVGINVILLPKTVERFR